MYSCDMDAPSKTAGNSTASGSNNAVAPFIMKTYQMVSDPATDHLIAWGGANNSFVVVDPLLFSNLILPSNFKHNNFSSFIRQLNTYGFRKVDPDRWEFANEWFLRGQKHLLKNIVRRKYNPCQNHHQQQQQLVLRRSNVMTATAEKMEREIERLKQEQNEMEKELQDMTKRLETTERRPEQMMAFLCKVVEDPEILPRMMIERERRTRQRQICYGGGGEKKRRLISSSPSPGAAATVSSSGRTEEEEGSSSLGVASSSPEAEPICQSSSRDTSLSEGFFGGGGMEGEVSMGFGIGGSTAPEGFGGGYMGFTCDLPAMGLEADTDANAPPYPFSLLGGGF